MTKIISKWLLGTLIAIGVAAAAPAQAQKKQYEIKLVAGSAGYDHIQPFMAEYLKFWEKYGLKVKFIGGNYQRSNQLMSIGDFDVGYNQFATAIRYFAAGIKNVIVASSSANCALIIANKNIKSWKDLKGKRFGIVTKFDVQYLTLLKHILPRHGMTMKDINPAQVPIPEIAAGLLTGDVAAAFPFEPFGTFAISKGAKLLVAAKDMIDKKVIKTDMLRNGLIMNQKFVKEHPELAKRVVWAHLDAVHLMRTDKSMGMKVLRHYNPKISIKLLETAYDNCTWEYNAPPPVWIETLIKWMKEEKIVRKDVKYNDVVDLSMVKSYPGYPGWKKLK
jgi:NitT/TauT family transport system substrate-binding protein